MSEGGRNEVPANNERDRTMVLEIFGRDGMERRNPRKREGAEKTAASASLAKKRGQRSPLLFGGCRGRGGRQKAAKLAFKNVLGGNGLSLRESKKLV